MNSRRNFFRAALTAGASAASPLSTHAAGLHSAAPPLAQTPDVADMPFTLDNGVKVFHLIAEPVRQKITPDKTLDLWGYNGSAPGPTIQVTEGDRLRFLFENRLPEPTAMHWHGLELPHSMDGGPGISQDPVPPGGRFVYEFTVHQNGTFFYHSHMAMQEMLGMLGAFIIHPRSAFEPAVDKDFVVLLQEYWVLPNNTVPNTMNMEFNWLLFNGKAGPATTPLLIRQGDRVRIRLINLGMDHHPIHLHGHTFTVTGTEGGRIPESARYPGNTVLVGVAQSRDVEFLANNPGDWMLHCHLPHHMMNQMTSNVGPMTRESMPGMAMSPISPDANRTPGFPQDAYMEGPMMAMDKQVNSPANYGLRSGWSGFMQGMMSFVRVLPPDQYEAVMQRVRSGEQPPSAMPAMHHHGM